MDLSPADSPLQPSWMPKLPTTEVIVPKKPRHTLRNVVIIVLIVALGVLAWWFFIGSKHEGDAQLGPLHVGDYNYIAACDVFTADDFNKLTKRTADRAETKAVYATKTDNQTRPERTYQSDCLRRESPQVDVGSRLSVSVQVWQYQNQAATKEGRLAFRLTGAAVNADLGGPADYLVPSLNFETRNKIVKVMIQGHKGLTDAEVEALAYAVGKQVSARIATRAAQPSAVLTYPARLSSGAFNYHSACNLWGAQDFEQLFESADLTNIRTTYAETLAATRLQQPLQSDCKIDSYPRAPGSISTEVSATVNVTYYPTVDAAAEEYRTTLNDARAVPGLGDTAAFTFSNGQAGALKMRKGPTFIQVHILLRSGPDATETEALSKLQAMATTILAAME